MALLQSFYALLLAPFEKLNTRIPWSLRRLAVAICAFGILTFPLATRIDSRFLEMSALIDTLHGYGSRRRVFVIAFLLALMIAASVEKTRRVEWNRWIFASWTTCGILVMIAGNMHNIGYAYVSMMFTVTVMFPCLYYVWMCRGDIEELYDAVAAAAVVEAYVYFAVCAAVAPMGATHTRYSGLNDNSNSFAISMICFVTASLYLVARTSGIRRVIPAASLGISVAMLTMSVSRTSILTGVLLCAVWLTMWFRLKLPVKALALAVIGAAIVSSASYFVLTRGHDPLHMAPSFSLSELSEVYADDGGSDSDGGGSAEDEDPDSEIRQRFDFTGSLNQISTGRIGIWKRYSEELNMTGNDISYTLPLKVIYYNGSVKPYSSPHNTTIELAFRAGIPAGILFACIELAGVGYVAALLFRRSRSVRAYELFCAMALTGFCAVGMLESMFKPFRTDLLMLFLFSAIPLFGMGCRGENLTGENDERIRCRA